MQDRQSNLMFVQALHEHQAIRMKVMPNNIRRRCYSVDISLFIFFSWHFPPFFKNKGRVDGATHRMPPIVVGEPRVRVFSNNILFLLLQFAVRCALICSACSYQMVSMSHEEASMKIGDVMCLCKVSSRRILMIFRSTPNVAVFRNN